MSQSLVGYQAAILPSLPIRMVEREWVMVLGSEPVTPTLKNCVTAGRSFSEGAAKSQWRNFSLVYSPV